MHYFLLGIVNAIKNLVQNSSSLGPLRAIPDEKQLYFKKLTKYKELKSSISNSAITDDDLEDIRESVDEMALKMSGLSSYSIGELRPHHGMVYWQYLANYITDSRLEKKSSPELLNIINAWLSDRFDAGYIIDSDVEIELAPVQIDDFEAEPDPSNLPSWLNVKLSLKDFTSRNTTYPDEVGVGISQIIPVIVAMLVETRLYIEQPELHLHPKLQLVVSDVAISRLNRMRDEINCWLVAETHSEHMILRVLRRIAESKADIKHRDYWLSKDEVTVYYVKNDGEGAVFHKLRVTDDGDFEDDWPDGFFEDRDTELFF